MRRRVKVVVANPANETFGLRRKIKSHSRAFKSHYSVGTDRTVEEYYKVGCKTNLLRKVTQDSFTFKTPLELIMPLAYFSVLLFIYFFSYIFNMQTGVLCNLLFLLSVVLVSFCPLCQRPKDKFPVWESLMDEACCLNVMSPRICGQSEIIPLPLVCRGLCFFFTFKYFYVSHCK